jgi:alpha-glucosidase
VQSAVVSEAFSPDNKIKVELLLTNDSLFYQVYSDNNLVVEPSNLGLRVTGISFLSGLTFVNSGVTQINENFSLPSGKKSTYNNNYRELTAVFQRSTQVLNVIFRVYNDGFAFRYALPRESGTTDISVEKSEINIRNFEYSWAQEYRNDYSWYYYKRNWTETSLQKDFCAPVLVKSSFTNFLITESANYGTYATSKIITNPKNGSFQYQPIGAISGLYPFFSPWRTIIMGSIPIIMQSTMVENLNPPTELTDLSWIKPGRSSWDWGGEDANNSVGFQIAKNYIDLAHEMGWEYFTLDEGWESTNADYTLADVVDYANSKSVGVILWSHHNRFTDNYNQISGILSAWKNIGIKGVKVDFWQDDQQAMMKKYDTFLKAAADQKLLVNFHGSTKPSGIRRKYPNLLTSEAVLGGEMYLSNSTMTPASHNINLTMTRNVIGSMDYTPGDFGTKNGTVRQFTTWSHQLALLTAFESGLQYYIDCPQNYKYHVAESFLKRIPTVWDSIICIEAKPDSFSTIARRKGEEWFVAALCNDARTLDLNLDFLTENKTYNAYIYKDGDCNSEIKFEYLSGLTNQGKISVDMLAKGGLTIQFSESAEYAKPLVGKYEAESLDNKTYAVKTVDNSGLCSGGKFVGQLGKINYLRFQKIEAENAGTYAMTVFYMTGENRSSYIKVNGGEELMYEFKSSGGYYGNNMGFVTVLVDLVKGQNIIEFGNKSDYCPNIDRITIKSVVDSSVISSVKQIFIKQKSKIYNIDNQIIIDSEFAGRYAIYDLKGNQLVTNKLNMGKNVCFLNNTGIYIVNVTDGSESYSTKIIVNRN